MNIVGHDYYNMVFLKLHETLFRRNPRLWGATFHAQYWQGRSYGVIDESRAHVLVDDYITQLYREIKHVVSRHSLMYWLHVYRRLAPFGIGEDKSTATVLNTRGIMEAAIQKYGRKRLCKRIALSDTIPTGRILRGEFMKLCKNGPQAPALQDLSQLLRTHPQFVLTDFGIDELIEVYDAESLAYEIWYAHAVRRSLGKGGELVIQPRSPHFGTHRSAELQEAITRFDSRSSIMLSSATGASFDALLPSRGEGSVLIPVYNIQYCVSADEISALCEALLGITCKVYHPTNMVLAPFAIRSFYLAHLPFSGAFEEKYGVKLRDVFVVLVAAIVSWSIELRTDPMHLGRILFRGYYVMSGERLRGVVQEYMSDASDLLAIKPDDAVDIEGALSMLTATDERVNLIDPGLQAPLSVFIPIDNGKLVVDYTWIAQILYHLFFGLNPKDQNFKGDLLEQHVQSDRTPLTRRQCRAADGSARQIDASYHVGPILVVAECKVKAMSFGFFRGDRQSIDLRTTDIVERALAEATEKATWLSQHPRGNNYDIRHFRAILPIAVSPFPEFIPSMADYYWLSDKLPRVMTPYELRAFLDDTEAHTRLLDHPSIVWVDANADC